MGTKNKEHIGRLEWDHIESLQGFDKQLCALTEVKAAVFCDCRFFYSTLDVGPLKNLGSSLVGLEIHNAETSPAIMEYLLAGLPKLRRLFARGLQIKSDPDFVEGSPAPFFKNSSGMTLFSMDYSQGTLGWIPPTAQFKELKIGALCAYKNPKLVEGWINSSCEILEVLQLVYDSDIDGMCFDQDNFQPSLLTL